MCEQEIRRLEKLADKTKLDELKQQQALAVAEAVHGLSMFNQQEVNKKLDEDFAKQSPGIDDKLVISHGSEFLNNNDPFF
eukprot:5774862-Karenia_brevis.AAC.1